MVSRESVKKLLSSTGKLIDFASPNEENAQGILEWIMPDLDIDDLTRSLRHYYKYLETQDERYVPYFDPVPGLFAKYSMIQKHQRVAKRIGLTWWPYIQKYVANPNYVLEMVGSKKPQIKKMLSTPLGDSYIKYFTKRLYEFFDLWFHEFPRFHNDCGGLIQYGLVVKATNSWGFRCRRCMTPIPTDQLDQLTYKQRKNKILKGSTYGGQKDTQ
jgi:hypothetical protein